MRVAFALALLAAGGGVRAQGGASASASLDSVRVHYAGLLTSGFEAWSFHPCGAWGPDSLGGTRFDRGQVGLDRNVEVPYPDRLVGPAPRAREPAPPWPATPRPERYPVLTERAITEVTHVVRGSGWLVGPRNNPQHVYGGFFPDRYVIRTDSFDEVREAMPGNCEANGLTP